MLVVDVEGFTADNVHHRSSMQIIEFFRVRHDEVTGPEGVSHCFPFREWDGDHREWTKIIFESAES